MQQSLGDISAQASQATNRALQQTPSVQAKPLTPERNVGDQAEYLAKANVASQKMSQFLGAESHEQFVKEKNYNDEMVKQSIDNGLTMQQIQKEHPEYFGAFGQGGSLAAGHMYAAQRATDEVSKWEMAHMDEKKSMSNAEYSAELAEKKANIIAQISGGSQELAAIVNSSMSSAITRLSAMHAKENAQYIHQGELDEASNMLANRADLINKTQDPNQKAALLQEMDAWVAHGFPNLNDQELAQLMGGAAVEALKQGDNTVLYNYLHNSHPELLDKMSPQMQAQFEPAMDVYKQKKANEFSQTRMNELRNIYEKAGNGELTDADAAKALGIFRAMNPNNGAAAEQAANRLYATNINAMEAQKAREAQATSLANKNMLRDPNGNPIAGEQAYFQSMQANWAKNGATPEQRQQDIENYLAVCARSNVVPKSMQDMLQAAVNAPITQEQGTDGRMHDAVSTAAFDAMHYYEVLNKVNPSVATKTFGTDGVQAVENIRWLGDSGLLTYNSGSAYADQQSRMNPEVIRRVRDGMTDEEKERATELVHDRTFQDGIDEAIGDLQDDGVLGENPMNFRATMSSIAKDMIISGRAATPEAAVKAAKTMMAARAVTLGSTSLDTGPYSIFERAGVPLPANNQDTTAAMVRQMAAAQYRKDAKDIDLNMFQWNYDRDTGLLTGLPLKESGFNDYDQHPLEIHPIDVSNWFDKLTEEQRAKFADDVDKLEQERIAREAEARRRSAGIPKYSFNRELPM